MPVAHANKDEGRKCLAIARRALADGDVSKAKKFAAKANSLYPGQLEIEQFLEMLERTAGMTPETVQSQPPSNTRMPSPTPSAASTGTASTSAASTTRNGDQAEGRHPSKSISTSDQQRLVKAIRSKKCHYEVLMISKTANDDEIKRAYRKLALRLHPDKNKAPGADEAFKMVSKAFSVLSNPQDRAHYDRYGDTEGMPAASRGFGGFHARRGTQYAASFNGVEVDAEELFRMFFGGNPFMGSGFGAATFAGGFGVPRQQQQQQQYGHDHHQNHRNNQGTRHYQHQQQNRQQQNQSSLIRLLMSIVPIVMLLVFNVFSGSASPYSLQQTREYPFPSTTSAHKVPFYVMDKAKFTKQFRPGSHERVRLEYEIEATYKEQIQRRCYQERLVKARYESYGQPDKAAKASLASCELLDNKFGSG